MNDACLYENRGAVAALYARLCGTAAAHADFQGRTLVPGSGRTDAGIVLVGEAPGGDEERLGMPFVGKAGKNLTSFLNAVGLSREHVYITNVVKVRPFKLSGKTQKPLNRPPNKAEIAFFTPFLHEELALIAPKVVVTLGNVALQGVLEDDTIRIGDVHGQALTRGAYCVFPLYHPAAVIYNQKLKDVYASDLHKLKEYMICIEGV